MKYILLIVVVVLLIFFVIQKITSSRWWRIKTIMQSQKREERENLEKVRAIDRESNNILNDEDRLKNIMKKIQLGEEVEIPLVAFDYIYRNINKFTIIDKTGKLILVNKEQYDIFENRAINLLDDAKKREKGSSNMLEEKPKKPIEVFTHPDGTIEKRDNVLNTITIIKPGGKKYVIDGEHNSLMIETKKEKEDNNNENNNGKTPDVEQKDKMKKMEQKINILDNKLNQKENNSKKTTNNSSNNSQKNDEENDETVIDIDAIVDDFKEEELSNKIDEKTENKKELVIQTELENDKKITEQKELEEKKRLEELEEKKIRDKRNALDDKRRKNTPLSKYELALSNYIRLSFRDGNNFIDQLTYYQNKLHIVWYLTNYAYIDLEKFWQYIYYNRKEKRIYINVELFLFKLYSLVEDEDKEKFLNFVKPDIESDRHNITFIKQLIKKINLDMTFEYGSNLIYMNQKYDLYYMKKKVQKIYTPLNQFKNEVITIKSVLKQDATFFEGEFIQIDIPKRLHKVFKEDVNFKGNTDIDIVKEYNLHLEDVKFKRLTFKSLYTENLKRIKASEKYSNS